ncbi:hypothetical protein M0R45_016742 [Rubus argutus]|uniref:Uncharacterized protein n=1 Tax=Rubus argutus TaxID=59490 RepID=A0AAW1XX18_RUBAR
MSGRSGVLLQDTLDFPLPDCSRLLLPPNPIPLSLSPLCSSNSYFLVIFCSSSPTASWPPRPKSSSSWSTSKAASSSPKSPRGNSKKIRPGNTSSN